MKNKFAIFLLVIVLLAIGILVFLIIREKAGVPQSPLVIDSVDNDVVDNNGDLETSVETPKKEVNEEKIADPALVNVDVLIGSVVKITDKIIIINDGQQEKEYGLVGQAELGVFKQDGEETVIIKLDQIKTGDKVDLEIRQSDKMVSVIMVK